MAYSFVLLPFDLVGLHGTQKYLINSLPPSSSAVPNQEPHRHLQAMTAATVPQPVPLCNTKTKGQAGYRDALTDTPAQTEH